MKQLEKEVESKVQVRFPDCDPFNHLNNSKYIDYIINAREDHLMQFYNLDIHKMIKESGLAWVVAQNQISYLFPAEVMETIVIQTRLINFTEKSLLVEAIVWNYDKTQIKAVMWSKLIHYQLQTKKSHLHSEAFIQFFNEICYPLPNEENFEERVKQLISTK